MSYTATDHFALLPAILLVLFGCSALLANRRWALVLLLSGVAFTAAALWRQYLFQETGELSAFGGALTIDRFALFFNSLFLGATALVAIVSLPYIEYGYSEYAALLLFAHCGMFFLAGGTDLMTLFLALELMGISFYVLVGFARGDRRSNEAAMKYLILGAFSSGLLAYGFSLLYGVAGSTNLREVANAVAARGVRDPLVMFALATVGAGVLFKVSAAPFHMWAPDAYEGAPTPAAAYLSVASKAASVALLMRLLLGPFAAARGAWEPALIVVAVASLTIGNLAAIAQSNVKRLLAYSSVAHAGYLLLGIVAGNETGVSGVAVYLLIYTSMTLGAFFVLMSLRRRGIAGENVADLAGLARKSPGHALLMLVFLLSLAGIPPTAGFLGKYYILQGLMETGHTWLAAVGTLYVVVSLYYYFRIVKAMFTRVPAETAPLAGGWGLRVALLITGVFTVAMGLYPEPFLRMAEGSVLR